MTRKNDLVIWLHLTETQIKIYQDFTNLDQVKEASYCIYISFFSIHRIKELYTYLKSGLTDVFKNIL